jgi:hypothetical protein
LDVFISSAGQDRYVGKGRRAWRRLMPRGYATVFSSSNAPGRGFSRTNSVDLRRLTAPMEKRLKGPQEPQVHEWFVGDVYLSTGAYDTAHTSRRSAVLRPNIHTFLAERKDHVIPHE